MSLCASVCESPGLAPAPAPTGLAKTKQASSAPQWAMLSTGTGEGCRNKQNTRVSQTNLSRGIQPDRSDWDTAASRPALGVRQRSPLPRLAANSATKGKKRSGRNTPRLGNEVAMRQTIINSVWRQDCGRCDYA